MRYTITAYKKEGHGHLVQVITNREAIMKLRVAELRKEFPEAEIQVIDNERSCVIEDIN
jgi:hypothetical protein